MMLEQNRDKILKATFEPGALTEQQMAVVWAAKARAGGHSGRAPSVLAMNLGVRKGGGKPASLDRIEAILKERGPMTRVQLAEATGFSENTIHDYMMTMATQGRIARRRRKGQDGRVCTEYRIAGTPE